MTADTLSLDATTGRGRALVRLVVGDVRMLASVMLLLGLGALAIVGPIISPYGPAQMTTGPSLADPSLAHPFGTDQFGRDLFARVADGARISLTASIIVASVSVSLGTVIGIVIGYTGGILDFAVGRGLDFMFAFPTVLLALTLATILQPSLETVILALTIIYVPVSARFVRSLVLSERTREYILSARVADASTVRILARHIIPNLMSPLLILATSIMAFSVLAEASLSFLGIGAQPPTASWGKMLTDNSAYITTRPFMVIVPGVAISLLVLAFNLLGDALRDHMDPRYRRDI